MIRAAFDIETVSPTVPVDERPEFGNPNDFEIQSVGIAVEEDGVVEDVHHVTRDGWGAESELGVIDRALDWLLTLDQDVTYTYNGEDFDIFLLQERARIRSEETGKTSTYERLEGFESAIGHEDLKHDVWDAYGNYTRLEDALQEAVFESEGDWLESQTYLEEYDHGVDWQSWPFKNLDDETSSMLTGAGVAILGEEYLSGLDNRRNDEQFDELERMLDHYVRNDVHHLFDLADARPY